MKIILPIIIAIFFISCKNNPEQAEGSWIKGSENEQIETIERQFRGFDLAMVETGYRYQELYWAGKDRNWEYANYQLEKIRLAIENGLQRRPKRAQSAQHFLNVVLPEMEKAVERQDSAVFNSGFRMMTANCNACHAMEKVTYFTVKTPISRQSPIRK